jgi:HD superfamily phosphodiesterase
VAHYGQQIAQAERADIDVVVAACLLHDVAHFDPLENYKDHGREGARLCCLLLDKLCYPPAKIDNICYAIAVHVDDKADFEHVHTP